MRRTTPNCPAIAAEQARLLERLDQLDVAAIARELEVFATDERRERLRSVFRARLDCVTVLMDAPHDPHNGAAVVRTCDAFGVHRLHVVERRERFLAARSVARGSERWVETHAHADVGEALRALARSGHELVATHPDGELLPADLARIPRVALVLGNERDGIDEELRAACKRSVRVPMRGFAESLNVSVTAAILLEQATAGRAGDLSEAEREHLYARALILTMPRAPEMLRAMSVAVPLESDPETS